MRFLITGASGFIGFKLVNYLSKIYGKWSLQLIAPLTNSHKKENKRYKILSKLGHDILKIDLLEDSIDINDIKAFDVLFHLAAFTRTEVNSKKVRVNDIGTEKLLNALNPLLAGKKVIYAGSILGIEPHSLDKGTIKENHTCTPRTDYGTTKLKGELIIKKMAGDIGFKWFILRLPTVYGPGYRPGGLFEVFPYNLKHNKFATRLNWPGHISLVYVDDVVKTLVFLAVKNKKNNEIYHIDSGENPSYDELLDKIAITIGVKRRKIKIPDTCWSFIRFFFWLPGLLLILPFPLRVIAWRISLLVTDGMVFDSTKLKRILPFKYTKLEKGLELTYHSNI